MERRELDQRVEGHEADRVQRPGVDAHLERSPDLERVGGHGEVGLEAQEQHRARLLQRQGHPGQLGEDGGLGVEVRVEAADRQQERCIAAPPHAQGRVAGDGITRHLRVVQ